MNIRTNLSRFLLIGLLALAFGLTGCELDDEGGADMTDVADTSTNPATASVSFVNGGVSETEVRIRPGGTVTFTNDETDVELILEIIDRNVETTLTPGSSTMVDFPQAGVYQWTELNDNASQQRSGNVVVE